MANINRVAYAVSDSSPKGDEEETRSYWTRVGVTFLNRDESETVVLDAIPVNGRLVLQEPKKAEEDES